MSAAHWRSQPFARSLAVLVCLAALLFTLSAWVRPAAPGAAPARQARVTVEAADDLEHKLFLELNRLRRESGLRPLRWSAALSRAATHHSRAMGVKGFFSHTSANGSSFRDRVERFYRRPPDWQFYAVGENLLRGHEHVPARAVLRRWLGSPGHRSVMLGRWRDVGFGVVRVQNAPGVYGGRSVAIVTADFGTRA